MNWTRRIVLILYPGVTAVICILPGTLSYGDIPKGALVGAWLFDEGQGDTVRDASGNGNHMTIADGHPEWVEGRFGMALEFDGDSDYLAAPDWPSLNSINGQAMSIVAWVKGTSLTGPSSYVVSRPLVYSLQAQNSKLGFYLCTEDKKRNLLVGNSGEGDAEIRTGEWAHLALVYNGEELRGYINGEVDVVGPVEGDIVTSDEELKLELRIGGDTGEPVIPGFPRSPGYFAGSIDEVGLFRMALAEEQIREIMRKGLTGLAVEPKDKLAVVWGKIRSSNSPARFSACHSDL